VFSRYASPFKELNASCIFEEVVKKMADLMENEQERLEAYSIWYNIFYAGQKFKVRM